MTNKIIKDKQLPDGQLESESFLTRLRNTPLEPTDLDLARQKYGYDLPEDVIELVARQQAMARPLLERYHTLHEQTPTLTIAKASMQKDMDTILDVFCGMDLNDLGDIGDYQDEYSCPKCAHRWSGAPNSRTGHNGVVYVPTGRVSRKSGMPSAVRYGKPARTRRNFSRVQRNWRLSPAAKLPRGFGNRPIGEPVVGEDWKQKSKPPAGYEDQ